MDEREEKRRKLRRKLVSAENEKGLAIRAGNVDVYKISMASAREAIRGLGYLLIDPDWEPREVNEDDQQYQLFVRGQPTKQRLSMRRQLDYLLHSKMEGSRFYQEGLEELHKNQMKQMKAFADAAERSLGRNSLPHAGDIERKIDESIEKGDTEEVKRLAKKMNWTLKQYIQGSQRGTLELRGGDEDSSRAGVEELRRRRLIYTPGTEGYKDLIGKAGTNAWKHDPDNFLPGTWDDH